MADDGNDRGGERDADDAQDDGFDPWADLEVDGPTEQGGSGALSIDDVSFDVAFDGAAEESPAVEAAADALVDAWLQEPVADVTEPAALSVFVPDEPVDGGETAFPEETAGWQDDPAAIEIGTGHSGVASASDLDVLGLLEDDAAITEPPAGEQVFGGAAEDAAPEPETVSFSEATVAGEPADADIIDFGTAAAGAATLAAVAAEGETVALAPPSTDAIQAKPRKRGLIGNLLGIVLGGLLAIPIVLGILIGLMWMGWRDTAGIRGWMPQQLAFLLPETRSSAPAGTPGGPDLAAAPSLDDLPAEPAAIAADGTQDDPGAMAAEGPAVAVEEPAADNSPPAVVEEPTPPVSSEPPAASEPPIPVVAEPPMTAAASTAVKVDDIAPAEPPATEPPVPTPPIGDLAAVVPPAAAAVVEEPVTSVTDPVDPPADEPEPLDLASLEGAIAAATAALDDVKALADPADPVRKVRLVNWYRQLTRVAQELVSLEHRAVESGRPLPATPAPAADFGGQLLANPELAGDLARLARNWLTYSRRDGDGVVMPATFSGVRRVGPYWCSRVVIAEAGNGSRELSVISRVEPAALPGDAVIVMGLVMDGGVLWASDLRSAAADGPPAADADPFGQSSP